MSGPESLPSPCACCGAYSVQPGQRHSVLLAVCDVLVVKALEKCGNYIVRAERSRFNRLGSKPYYLAHTVWEATDQMVDKALKGAWDVVPAILDVHGCCDITSLQVTQMLDSYVHDLVITGTPHSLMGEGGLAYRFESRLGLTLVVERPSEITDTSPSSEAVAIDGRGLVVDVPAPTAMRMAPDTSLGYEVHEGPLTRRMASGA